MVTADSGKMNTDEKPPPLARWQSRQWQLSAKSGEAEDS